MRSLIILVVFLVSSTVVSHAQTDKGTVLLSTHITASSGAAALRWSTQMTP